MFECKEQIDKVFMLLYETAQSSFRLGIFKLEIKNILECLKLLLEDPLEEARNELYAIIAEQPIIAFELDCIKSA